MLEELIIFGAKYLVALPPVALAALFFTIAPEKRRRLALLAIISLPSAYLLARVAGLLYSHPQPFVEWGGEPLVPHAIDNAFPSDHALLAAGIAAIVGLFNRLWGGGLLLIALLIALARLAAGLHNAIDIAFSALLAFLVVYLADALIARLAPPKSI